MKSVLITAVTGKRYKQAAMLLKTGSDVNVHDDCRQTALIHAVFLEPSAVRQRYTRLFLRHGASVCARDLVGRNALTWACLFGRDDLVNIMLPYALIEDLDLNQKDIKGMTMLHYAVASGNAALVKVLVATFVKYDISVDIGDKNGVTPFMLAIKLCHDVCASILLVQGMATVGVNMKGPSDIIAYEKVNARDRRSSEVAEGLPPLLPRDVLQKVKIQEMKASQLSLQHPTALSDDEGDGFSSGSSYFSQRSIDDVLDTPVHAQHMSLSSTSSSTDGIVGTDLEDDNDDLMICDLERKDMTLNDIYHIYEDQHSPAYVPPARGCHRYKADDTEAHGIYDADLRRLILQRRMFGWENCSQRTSPSLPSIYNKSPRSSTESFQVSKQSARMNKRKKFIDNNYSTV